MAFADLTIWVPEPLVFSKTIMQKILPDGTTSLIMRQRLYRNRNTNETAWFDEYIQDGIAPCC